MQNIQEKIFDLTLIQRSFFTKLLIAYVIILIFAMFIDTIFACILFVAFLSSFISLPFGTKQIIVSCDSNMLSIIFVKKYKNRKEAYQINLSNVIEYIEPCYGYGVSTLKFKMKDEKDIEIPLQIYLYKNVRNCILEYILINNIKTNCKFVGQALPDNN